MTFSMTDVLRAKRLMRAAAAAMPIAEKLRVLERLRDRERLIKCAVAAPEQPGRLSDNPG